MTDTHLDRLRGNLHTGEHPVSTPHCLDAETVAALADGTVDDQTRARALEHVATCALCRRAVASVTEALADRPITHEIERVEGRSRRRLQRVGVPLAAVAVLLLLLWSPQDDRGPVHRGPPPPAAAAPIPRSPLGTVAEVEEMRWSGVVGADRYRVTLFDAGGRVLYETEVADTAAALPDSVTLVPGRRYLWKADARTGFDRWVTSPFVEFSIARARSR